MLTSEQQKTLSIWVGEYINHYYIKPMFEAKWKTETIRKKLNEADRYELAELAIDYKVRGRTKYYPEWSNLLEKNYDEIKEITAITIDNNLDRNFKKWAKRLRNQTIYGCVNKKLQ